jgi:hypothetical protein
MPASENPPASSPAFRSPPRHVKMEVFHGRADENLKEWIKDYDTFSTAHGYDDAMKMANVKYFLKDGAKRWFNNQEDNLKTYDDFKKALLGAYVNEAIQRERADKKLRHRAQKVGESCFDYVQDVIHLCNQVNSSMNEAEKVQYIMRGIAQSAFLVLLLKNAKTIKAVLDSVKELDSVLSSRIDRMDSFDRLENVIDHPVYTSSSEEDQSSESDTSDESEQVPFRFPKSKARRHHKSSKAVSSKKDLHDTISEIVEGILSRRLPSTENPDVPKCNRVTLQSAVNTRSEKRPEDRVCWYCHRRGHVQRFCRQRPPFFPQPSDWRSRQAPAFNALPNNNMYSTWFPRYEPYTYTSTQRQDNKPRSPSPAGRRLSRSPSPHPNRFRQQTAGVSGTPENSR